MLRVRANKWCRSLFSSVYLIHKRVKIRPFWANTNIEAFHKTPHNYGRMRNIHKIFSAYCSHSFRVYCGNISDDTSKDKLAIKVTLTQISCISLAGKG